MVTIVSAFCQPQVDFIADLDIRGVASVVVVSLYPGLSESNGIGDFLVQPFIIVDKLLGTLLVR